MSIPPPPSVALGVPRRPRNLRRRSRAAASLLALQQITLMLMGHPRPGVQCLVTPRQGIHRAANVGSRVPSAPLSFLGAPQSIRSPRHLRGFAATYPPATSTALPLFDKFLHPYGISNRTNDHSDDDFDEASIELLNALLPRLKTEEERARLREEFHRARLDHQLRLSKRERGKEGGDAKAKFLADSAEEVARMTDLFQQARLREQLRLSKRTGEDGQGGLQHSGDISPFDKDEAFQRALLEERLRIRRLQRQRDHFLSSPKPLEMASMEYEIEANEMEGERSGLRTMTMVDEREEESDDNAHDAGEEIARAEDNAVVVVGGSNESGDGNGNVVPVGGDVLPVNQTEDVTARMLREKLEGLQEMVTIATSSSADAPPAVSADKPKLSLQNFLSSTHLPLSPREDASALSLVLAPIAHMLTAAFLLGAAGIYAVLAVADVLWNDTQDTHSTRKCLREASSVMPQCVDYVFPKEGANVQRSAFQRTLRALQTSCIASYYAVECIVVRAAKHSRWAHECMDAGTGALRYLVYAARSLNVIWIRAVDALVGSPRNKDQANNLLSWTRKLLNPVGAVSRRFNKQRSQKDEQRRLQSDELYTTKLRQLNSDRVALEREKRALKEGQRELEFERRKVLGEGVSVLTWYAAAREAAAEAEDSQEAKAPEKKKKRWSLWS